ncbi:hypothetical protein DOTSEDRAFT_67592, partial [Dothistroma septosporum NZE10]
MPYAGRGGAGNIQAVEQETKRLAADIEAGQDSTRSFSQFPPTLGEQQYAYKGRGGAGNWYSPKDLSDTGVYKDFGLSQRIGDGVNAVGHEPLPQDNAGASEQVRKLGRGGAGNYAAYDASEGQTRAQEKKLEADREAREMVKANVEEKVKSTLVEPPRAKLAGAEPY